MNIEKRKKYGMASDEVQVTRGTSFFRNIQICWLLSDDFGLTVSHLRCGLCLAPLESHAIKLDSEIYLVCEEGHLLGNETEPETASAKSREIRNRYQREIQKKKHHSTEEYQNLVLEVMEDKKNPNDIQEWETDVPSCEHPPRFTSRQEYNLKLEMVIGLFKDSHFQRKQLKHDEL